METVRGRHGDRQGSSWRPSGVVMETVRGRHGDRQRTCPVTAYKLSVSVLPVGVCVLPVVATIATDSHKVELLQLLQSQFDLAERRRLPLQLGDTFRR